MTYAETAQLIGLDWGTTSLRAHVLGPGGKVLDRKESNLGILADHEDGFEGTFVRMVSDWLGRDPGLPVIASGMITSRNGWVETPYVPVPGGLADLAASLVPFDLDAGLKIHFVCGMDRDPVDGTPDIMRGEETQIVGCLAHSGDDNGLFVMPGTHSKWVQVQDGKLKRFDSYMTGEVYAVLKGHSILGRLMEPGGGGLTSGFEQGVLARLGSGASLLRHIFSARTMVLYDRLSPEMTADYLSGLLIGEEVRAAAEDFRLSDRDGTEISIVGSGELTERYALALRLAGLLAISAPKDSAAMGQYAIAAQAGLITPL